MTLLILILLHAAGGHMVEVNTDQITSMRSPRDVKQHERLFAADAHCLVNLTDGKFVVVQEDCDTVKKMAEGNR